MSEELKAPKRSTVTVGIKRLLNTAQFENLEIQVTTSEEIKWTTLAERGEKVDKITTILAREYQKTQSTVLAELGVTEKRAWFRQTGKPIQGNNTQGDDLLN